MQAKNESSVLSMEKLITEVQKQPIIWNVHHPCYSDKKLKMKAWQTICRVFYPVIVHYSADETYKISFIQKKWKSVRDYYIKQRKELKTDARLGGLRKRKYVYFDMLQFLEANNGFRNTCFEDAENLRTIEEKIEEDSLDISEEMVKIEEADEGTSNSSDPETEESNYQPILAKKQEIDEDEMFLLSLVPSIRKFTPLQKLDFKLEILEVLKKIQFSTTTTT